jgi:hypothetical protein
LISTVPTTLADRSSYALRYVFDAHQSVGVSASADGGSFRLVEVVDGRENRELRRLPTARGPQYDGFTVADGLLYWVETAVESDGTRSRLWSARVNPGEAAGAPSVVVDDMGPVVFYDSAFDIIVADGTISWAIAANPIRPGTIVRSVPVGGGPVAERGYAGPWRQTTRPWLVSATTGSPSLLNMETGQLVAVASTGAEGVSCGAAWCRFTIQNAQGTVRLDLVRPDGSQRTRIAGPGTKFEGLDPGLLDRYELFNETGGELAEGDRRLMAYDIQRRTTTVIEVGPGALVNSRGTYAWWLSGDYRSPIWHVLDLRTLG